MRAAADFPDNGAQLVYSATTNIGGAGKWLDDEYSPYLKGKKAFVFQDNDEPGRKHAQHICLSASKYAQAVHLVELPGLPDKGDVTDYLQQHTSAELFALMQSAPKWTPPAEPIKTEPAEIKSRAYRTIAPDDARESSRFTGDLLDSCRNWMLRFIVASDAQVTVMAAWVLHTYALTAAETTPYIHITAPEKACGKSRVMETLEAISANPVVRVDDCRCVGALH